MQIGEAATASSAAAGHFSPTQRWNNNCGPTEVRIEQLKIGNANGTTTRRTHADQQCCAVRPMLMLAHTSDVQAGKITH